VKTITFILAMVAAAFLSGCTTPTAHRDYSNTPPTAVEVSVKCSAPAMDFTGTIVSDGHWVKYSGTGHRTFHVTGHDIVCSFKKAAAADGSISISVSEAGQDLGNSYSGNELEGVRAAILRTPSAQHTIFTAF
jgi:hypothetical protein